MRCRSLQARTFAASVRVRACGPCAREREQIPPPPFPRGIRSGSNTVLARLCGTALPTCRCCNHPKPREIATVVALRPAPSLAR
ncbi:hypothetical protein GLA29479_4064 [Lysobacter antibioticus]|nr:hypothetical protein GLA29479_4064 [Lysobacter antibioticus]